MCRTRGINTVHQFPVNIFILSNSKIFDISSIISYLSEIVSLKVGDTIWTGTPSGVGIASGKFLQDGDVLTSTIEGLGTMENKCVRVSDHSRANVVPEFMKGFMKS